MDQGQRERRVRAIATHHWDRGRKCHDRCRRAFEDHYKAMYSVYDHKRTCENSKPKMSGMNMMQRVLEPVTYTSSPATVTCIPCFLHPTSTGCPASQQAVLAIQSAASRELVPENRRSVDSRVHGCGVGHKSIWRQSAVWYLVMLLPVLGNTATADVVSDCKAHGDRSVSTYRHIAGTAQESRFNMLQKLVSGLPKSTACVREIGNPGHVCAHGVCTGGLPPNRIPSRRV